MASNQHQNVAHAAADRINESAHQTVDAVDGAAQQGKGLLQSAGDTVSSYAISAKNAVVGKSRQATESAKQSGHEAVHQTEKGVDNLNLGEKADRGAQQSKSLLQSVGDSVLQTGTFMKDAVIGNAHRAPNTTVAGSKADEAKHNAGRAADTSKGYLEQLGDQVVSLKDRVVGKGLQEASAAQEKLGQGKDSTGQTLESGVEQSKGMLQTVGEMAFEYAQTAKDFVLSTGSSALQKTEDMAGQAKNQTGGLLQRVGDSAASTFTSAKDYVVSTEASARDAAADVLRTAQHTTGETTQAIRDKTVDTTSSTKEAVVNSASKAYTGAADLSHSAYQRSASAANSTKQSAADTVNSGYRTMGDNLQSAKDTFSDTAVSAKKTAAD